MLISRSQVERRNYISTYQSKGMYGTDTSGDIESESSESSSSSSSSSSSESSSSSSSSSGNNISNFEITTTGAETVGVGYTDAVDLKFDWGDGNIEYVNGNGEATNDYAGAGTYTLTMQGGCSRFNFSTNPNALTAILTPINGITGVTSMYRTFMSCPGLTSLPDHLFDSLPDVISFGGTFRACNNISNLPTDLFKYNTLVESFNDTFYGCSGITSSIPTDLFRYNILVKREAFMRTFQFCSGLTGSIPTDLFRYNTLVDYRAFRETFYQCTNLTGSIPTDLFRYNVNVGHEGFLGTFQNCQSLTGAIPTDLFRYNVLTSGNAFYYTFINCYLLESAPDGLFKYDTACTSFAGCFQGCYKLVMSPWLFYDTLGSAIDRTNRFTGLTVSFINFFNVVSTAASAGTAPDLWLADGTLTGTEAYTGHSAASLTNYSDVPIAWGGADSKVGSAIVGTSVVG